MTGRRNRAPNAAKFGTLRLPNWFFPPAPPPIFPRSGNSLFGAKTRQIFWRVFAANISSVWLFIWIIKMGYRGFQAEANSHIIKREHHLVAGLFVCANSLLTGYRVVVGADPYNIKSKYSQHTCFAYVLIPPCLGDANTHASHMC